MASQDKSERKRENFFVTPEIEADVEFLQSIMNVETKKDVYVWSVRMAAFLAAESQRGNLFYQAKPIESEYHRLPLPWIESPQPEWSFLVARPHSWRKQLFVKGTKIPASVVWNDLHTEKLTPEQAAKNWDIPVEAVRECIVYCEKNKELLRLEALEARQFLESEGLAIDPPETTRR